jgi:hypothetical protein
MPWYPGGSVKRSLAMVDVLVRPNAPEEALPGHGPIAKSFGLDAATRCVALPAQIVIDFAGALVILNAA